MSKGNGQKCKDNLKYAQKKINNLPEDDKYKSILVDIYRAIENLRHSNADTADFVYKQQRKIK